LAEVFCQGDKRHFSVEESYPADAQLVNSYIEGVRQIVWLVMAHPSFDPVEEGDEIPACHIQYTVYTPQGDAHD